MDKYIGFDIDSKKKRHVSYENCSIGDSPMTEIRLAASPSPENAERLIP